MPPACSSPATGCSRSSAPCAFHFSTIRRSAKRKAACEAEIAVNAPYAPEIYRGVVAITRGSDGGLAIGGNGEPVEWAVDMHRFDETRTLDHMAKDIDDVLADALGRAVAAAHAKTQGCQARSRGSKRSVRTSTNTSRRSRNTRRFFRPPKTKRSRKRAAPLTIASCRCCTSAAATVLSAASTAIFISATSC